jgi:hypothetical protein
MNEQGKFWRNQHEWPRDTPDYVFLGRVVHLLGRAMFMNEWIGDEPTLQLLQELPKVPLNGSSGRAYYAHDLLMKNRPDLRRKPIHQRPRIQGLFTPPPTISFTKKEWQAALDIIRENNERCSPGLIRLAQVREKIINMAADGTLATALRPIAGGDQEPAPPVWWNTERAFNRFYYCQMNPIEPFSIAVAGDEFRWIYVRRDSLAIALNDSSPPAHRSSAPAPASNKGGRPDEYNWAEMKEFARQLVQAKGYPGPNNRALPTKAQLVEAVTNEFAEVYDQHPAQSSVRRRVNGWLVEFAQN